VSDVVVLTERTRFGGETGAAIMRNRCAFTTRDMADDWPAAFTYAIVLGWGDEDDPAGLHRMAAKWEWDDALVEFLIDAHQRFRGLADKVPPLEPARIIE
jgi:hypothetical protein